MQGSIKTQIRKGQIDAVLPLIAKKAWATFDKLPKHAQVWYGLDDLIQLGSDHAVTTVLSKHSDRRKNSASYVTYLYKSIDNLYKDVLKEQYAAKRQGAKAIYSLDSASVSVIRKTACPGQWEQQQTTLESFTKRKTDRFAQNENKIIARIDAERAFLRAYENSSPLLRKFLIRWILQPRTTKNKMYGSKYRNAKKEFRDLKITSFLSSDHCRTIMFDMMCRRNICNQLVHRFRTPRNKTTENPSLCESVEQSLVGVLR